MKIKLLYDYFDEVQRRIGDIVLPEAFLSQIFQYNLLIRKKIIDESQLIENFVAKTMIKVINYEINLIKSHN